MLRPRGRASYYNRGGMGCTQQPLVGAGTQKAKPQVFRCERLEHSARAVEVLNADTVRVIHIIAGLDPAHGGPSYTVPRLCAALGEAGAEVELLSVALRDAGASDTSVGGYRDRRFPWDYAGVPVLGNLRYSSELVRALRQAASGTQLVHNHGLWLLPNVQVGWTAAKLKKPLVVAPRGMLGPAALNFSRRKKLAFWHLLQGAVVRRAACLHATSEQEYQEIRAFGLSNPVAVIPNGIDLPAPSEAPVSNGGKRTVLSLGRIHPKKGLDRLVRAWARLEAEHPDWRLRIIGPSEVGHAEQLRALAATLNLHRLSIEGPVYGDAKLAIMRAADLFALPSLNENFAITVAEALAAGTPVIATKGSPWSGLETEGCGWWIDHGVELLATALEKSMSMPQAALKAMGAKGQAWVVRDFSWGRVARDMLSVYCWLLGRAQPPALVRFN
jgi:glycosyltransferase involved in cell wall biosynthesis